jgi:hypothetical protein
MLIRKKEATLPVAGSLFSFKKKRDEKLELPRAPNQGHASGKGKSKTQEISTSTVPKSI